MDLSKIRLLSSRASGYSALHKYLENRQCVKPAPVTSAHDTHPLSCPMIYYRAKKGKPACPDTHTGIPIFRISTEKTVSFRIMPTPAAHIQSADETRSAPRGGRASWRDSGTNPPRVR